MFSYFSYILFPYFIQDVLFLGQYSYDHYKRINIWFYISNKLKNK